MDDIYEIAQLILHSQSFMIKLETRVNAQMHLTTLTNKGAPHSAMASPAAVSAISLLVRVLWPVPISGDDKRSGGCQVHGSRSRRKAAGICFRRVLRKLTMPMKMWTAMNSHASSGVVAHPVGACFDKAYRLVLVAMVEMSEGGRKHCR